MSFRPMQWDCAADGCFNVKRRPKFGVFFDCFPRQISFTDVDATVEINGFFLFLEFKSGEPGELKSGQRIYLERLTRLSERVWAVIVCADLETMEATHLKVIRRGLFGPWERTTLSALKDRLARWAERVDAQPRLKIARAA